MSKIEPIPAGHEHLIPHLVCDPCAEAIEFYKKAFGAEELRRLLEPEGSRIMHAVIRVGTSFIFLNDDFPENCGGTSQSATALKGTPVTLHRYVENCDAAMKQAAAAGATVMMPATDMFWGDRYGLISDPYGHRWAFATHQHDLTNEQVQAAMAEACAEVRSAR